MSFVCPFDVYEFSFFGQPTMVTFDVENQIWWNLRSFFTRKEIHQVLTGDGVEKETGKYQVGNSQHYLWTNGVSADLNELFVSNYVFLSFFLRHTSQTFRLKFSLFTVHFLKEKVHAVGKLYAPVSVKGEQRRRFFFAPQVRKNIRPSFEIIDR